MNTTIMNESIAVAANPVVKVVTARDVAEKLGISICAVHSCMSKNPRTYSEKKVDLVRKTAAEMGYDPCKARGYNFERIQHLAYTKEARKKAMETKWLHHSNFQTRDLETKRMEELRGQGYSNREVAKKVGRSYQCVLNRIGYQPEDMTKENVVLGQKNRAAKNAQRRQYVADHTIREYNGLVTKLDQVNEKIVELNKDVVAITGQIKAMEPKVVEASKVSSVEVKQLDFQPDLMSAAPTMAM